MLNAKQGGIKYYFWVFGITWPGIEPQFLASTLTIMQITDIIWVPNSSVNIVNYWTTYTDDLLIVVKACVETATVSRIDNSVPEIFQNNTPQVWIQNFSL